MFCCDTIEETGVNVYEEFSKEDSKQEIENITKYIFNEEQKRFEYFKDNPNDIDARSDESPRIRMLWFKNHKFDPIGRVDPDSDIRSFYYLNNPLVDGSKDPCMIVRLKYFRNNPDDERATIDPTWSVRKEWFKNHPNDERAAFDDSIAIRMEYFRNHRRIPLFMIKLSLNMKRLLNIYKY